MKTESIIQKEIDKLEKEKQELNEKYKVEKDGDMMSHYNNLYCDRQHKINMLNWVLDK